jgi:hypothetical protein
MKTLLSLLLLGAGTASLSVGQSVSPSLNQESAFREELLESIQNPTREPQKTKTTNVYVDFFVSKNGKIENVKIIGQERTPAVYVAEVNRAFAQLSRQKSLQAGEYVLPVVFEATGKAQWYPAPSVRPEVHRTYIQLLHDRKLLDELYVTAAK